MTIQELEADYDSAKAEMDYLLKQMAEADRNHAPLKVHEELIQSYEAAKERRRLAFNIWMTAEMES